jgi:hypothetical protein
LIDRAGGGAAGTEDATDGLFEEVLLIRELNSLLVGRRFFCDQIRLDGLISLKKGTEIDNEILHDLKYGKGFDEDLFIKFPNQLLARQAADTVDPHAIRSADPVATRPPEGEGGILFPSNPVEAIQNPVQWICFNLKILVSRLFVLLRIKSKNL